MFKRILAPLDGSERSEEALPFARELAKTDGAEIYLLHVRQVRPDAGAALGDAAVERRMHDLAKGLRAQGVTAHVLTLTGQTPDMVAAVASVHKIDLIALAPESHGLLEWLWRPSVTAGVLERAPIPALIAPRESAGAPGALLEDLGAQVIVPLDGSPLAERALPLAREMAARYGRGLLLLRIIPPSQVIGAGAEVYPPLRDETEYEMREAGAYLTELCGQAQRDAHVPAQYMIGLGAPTERILSLAETKPGSLIVMSAHGRGRLARLLLGSVALSVARKVSLPLLIVPPADAHGAVARLEVALPTEAPGGSVR